MEFGCGVLAAARKYLEAYLPTCSPVTGARREHCVAQDEHALARDICGKDLIRSGRRCSCREHRPCLTAHLSRVLHCLSMLRVNRHEKRP